MSSLADEISKLANPLPVFEDPEDVIDETAAKLPSRHADEDENNDFSSTPSKLRSRAAALNADEDTKYSGKCISRQNLTQDQFSEDSDSESDAPGLDTFEDSEESTDDDDKVGSGDDVIKSDEEDEALAGFKETLKFQDTSKNDFSFEEDGDHSKYAEDYEEDDEDDSQDEDDDDDEESDAEESDEVDGTETEGEDGVQKFTKVNVEEEIQKGKAVRAQLGLWDSLLESRIKLQKVLQVVNQLPQPDTHDIFLDECGPEYGSALREGESFLYKLLDQLTQLQSMLLLQNQDTRQIGSDQQPNGKPPVVRDDTDDEITSESDNDDQMESSQSKPLIQKPKKRKLQPEEYPDFLAKRHQDFKQFRNTTIQKWYDKTRISSGKLAKGFSAFEQSAVKQIEQVLSDKDRLIKRTQLKRTAYRILGTAEVKPTVETVEGPETSKEDLPRRDHLHDYDEEIFDDDDFYHQQLRELIETKTADISDPVTLSRHWLEIQKLRKRSKKKVDTKASKGRKIRYNVHKKLVNFMAPYDTYQWTEEAKNELFRSLFGKKENQEDHADR